MIRTTNNTDQDDLKHRTSHARVGRRAPKLGQIGCCLLACSLLSFSQDQIAAQAARPAPPTFSVIPAQGGAVIVSIRNSTAHTKIYYTVDGSLPSTSSQQYLAPFLVSSKETVRAISSVDEHTDSSVAEQTFAPSVMSGALVWSDEFSNETGKDTAPDAGIWTYDTGASGYGNSELEDYCASASSATPCSKELPNAYVGTDGFLHLVARRPGPGVYTSARMKTQGLFSFRYGRIEFRAKLPESQGLWPAGWLLGNTVSTHGWPASGEQDVLERVGAAKMPDWNQGSIHGPGFTGTPIGTAYNFPANVTASTWHTYGMIWKPGSIAYYVDDPQRPYVTFWPSSLNGMAGATWPFDGPANFILLNLAVGGQWPGNPDASTSFPAEMLIDYVRIYSN